MNPDIIYAKTAKGLDEVNTRACKLPARIRALLIMVDGKMPVAALIARASSPEEAAINFKTLADGGFIEARGLGPSAASSPSAPPAGVDPLEVVKTLMAQAMVQSLGPDADYFTGRIESATSLKALAELAPKYLEVVRAAGGKKKADAFKHLLEINGVFPPAATAPPEGGHQARA